MDCASDLTVMIEALGGEVDGSPTSPSNCLLRIRELRSTELKYAMLIDRGADALAAGLAQGLMAMGRKPPFEAKFSKPLPE